MSTEQQEAPTSTTGSYVYGIVRAGTRIPEGLEPVPNGDEDGQLGLVTEGRLAAVVSDVAIDRPLGTRRDLMAHERVLNAIAQETAVLPMRFGGVVRDDDAVAEELLAQHEDYFAWALDQLEGLTEFSLRGEYDQDDVMRRVVSSDPEIQRLSDAVRGVDEDASYYDRIKLGESISHALDRLRENDSAAAAEALAPYAEAQVVKDAGGEWGALHIAFLVRNDHRTDFERAVDELGDEWSGRVELRLIGPTASFDFLPEAPNDETTVEG